ncbi:MAG: efflux RND transporter periplasmic adaptor subunit [Prochloraceae cyanobacterium]|nr:efflux RND transporter periplasmic adaptor subunit [Prochloraceae cyanobacterium]
MVEKEQLPALALGKKSRWLLPLGAIALLVGGGLIGRVSSSWQQSTERVTNNGAKSINNIEQVRLTVKTVPAQLEPIQAWVFGDGYVSAVSKKHLSFQVEGTIEYIKQVNGRDLREGDRVRQGDLLARVDRRKSDAEVTVAKAGLLEAKSQVFAAVANLRQAEANLAQVEAELQKAKTDAAFAAADWKRYKELVEQGAVEQREVDVKETNYKNAQAEVIATAAQLRSSQAQLDYAKTEIETAKAGVVSANARLNQSMVEGEDTEIIAPFDGIISRLNIRKGDYWTPDFLEPTGNYQRIVERLPIIIIAPDEFEVILELPAFQGEKVKPGQRAFIILDQNLTKANSSVITAEKLMQLASAAGSIFSVSPSISPGERSVNVRIRVTQGQEQNLQDGQHVSVWMVVEEKERATVAPFSAFIFRDRQPYVFVVNQEEGTVEQRQITQGIEGLAKREILAGVKPGELLVIQGKNRLVNGAPVEVIP